MKGAPGLADVWSKTVRRHPDKKVLIDLRSGQSWTARQVDLAAERLAAQRLASSRGRVLAIALPNTPDWIFYFLAAQKTGRVVVPLDPSQPAHQQQESAQRLGATLLVQTDGLTPLTPRKRYYRRPIVFVKLTSGTTGQPKAWPCQARHLLQDGKQVCRTMGLRPDDFNLGLIPLGHSYGMGNLVLPLLLHGTGLAVASEFLPSQIPAWVKQHALTVFPTVPSILHVLSRLPSPPEMFFRLVISAGAPLPPDTARSFQEKFGITPRNFYGSSETGGICYDRTGRSSLTGTDLGPPLHGVTVRITGRHRIEVSSGAVLTRTGTCLLRDRGRLHAHGRLSLLTREAPPANIGGKKVYPGEILQWLLHQTGVREAWVWVRSAGGRDHLAAAVETDLALESVQQHLAAKVSPWKLPKVWFARPLLPRNARGKLDRSDIEKWA